MIQISISSKRFQDQSVLKNVRLTIAPGETVAVLGRSGIGKTTLAWIAAGLDTDFDGSVERDGQCAMVFQEPTLLPWRSALANVQIATGVSFALAKEALEEVGLREKSNHFPGQLSLGQQRRLALARALAATPDILILDEPFTSLDGATHSDMLQLTANLFATRQIAVLLVTHSQEEVIRLANRAIILQGTPASVAADLPLDRSLPDAVLLNQLARTSDLSVVSDMQELHRWSSAPKLHPSPNLKGHS